MEIPEEANKELIAENPIDGWWTVATLYRHQLKGRVDLLRGVGNPLTNYSYGRRMNLAAGKIPQEIADHLLPGQVIQLDGTADAPRVARLLPPVMSDVLRNGNELSEAVAKIASTLARYFEAEARTSSPVVACLNSVEEPRTPGNSLWVVHVDPKQRRVVGQVIPDTTAVPSGMPKFLSINQENFPEGTPIEEGSRWHLASLSGGPSIKSAWTVEDEAEWRNRFTEEMSNILPGNPRP